MLHDAGMENVEQRWYTASKCSSLISFLFLDLYKEFVFLLRQTLKRLDNAKRITRNIIETLKINKDIMKGIYVEELSKLSNYFLEFCLIYKFSQRCLKYKKCREINTKFLQ